MGNCLHSGLGVPKMVSLYQQTVMKTKYLKIMVMLLLLFSGTVNTHCFVGESFDYLP